jgi:thiol-disulfide isomerase/thioredoxin
MKYLAWILIVSFYITQLSAQGYEISIQLENYPHEVLKLGYHFGDKQYIKDSTFLDKKSGKFVFKADTLIESGVYLVILAPDNKYFQILVDDNEQRFSLKTNAENPEANISFKGSAQNTLFYEYMKGLGDFRKEMDELKSQFPEGDTSKLLQEKSAEINKKVKLYQKKIFDKNPNQLLSLIISFNFEIEDIPEFEGTEDEKAFKRFYFMRDHYFDFIAKDDKRLIRTPLMFQKVDYFVNKMHAIVPDSTLDAVEKVLDLFQNNESAWRFFLSHFLNTYHKSKYVGMDMIYVHLVEKYYATGKASWVSEENLEKIVKQARDWKPILLGKKAPNILMQKQDGSEIALHDIKSEYTVLIFWAPDCGHCQKTMPDVIAFADKYRDKGVTVFSVCGKLGDVDECWQMVKKKNMQNLLNVTDASYRSRFKEKFDVQTTPKIFILDKDKTILSKNIGPQQLDEIVSRLMEMEADKNGKS